MKLKIRPKAYIYILLIFSFFYYNFLESCCFNNRVDVATEDAPLDIAFSPDGTCAIVNNSGSNTLSIYNVTKDASDNCVLTPSNPATIATGNSPVSIAFSPDGTCVLVTNRDSDSLSIYNVSKDINGNCVLTPSNPSTVATQSGPFDVAFSPDGSCVIISHLGSNTLSIYNATSTGGNCTLTPSNPATISVQQPISSLAFSPDGTCLVVGNGTLSTLSIFNITSVNDNCTLTFSTTDSVPSGSLPFGITFSPDGTCLVATSQTNNILTIYNVTQSNNNCIVSPSNPASIATGNGPLRVKFSPDGSCVFVANQLDNNISTYTVSNVNGNCTLTPSNTISTGTDPVNLAFTPDGNCLAVTNALANTVSIFRITVLVNITASNPVLCPNDQVILTANVSGGQAPYTYQWFQDESEIIGATSDMLIVTTPGAYSVTVTDANGCENTASFTVTLAPAISVNITSSNPAICNNNPVMLTANVTGGTAPFSYQWLFNGNPVGTDSPILVATDPGNYSVTVSDANSCSVTSSLTTIVEDNIAVNITPNNSNACPNTNLTANITDGVGPIIFEWTLNGITISNSQTITVTTSGNYSVTVTDTNSCSATDSLNITVDTIAVNISVDDLCQNNPTLTANVTGGIAPFSYQWLFNGNSVGTDSPMLVATASGDYSVTVTDANGCSNTDSLNITVDTIAVTISVDDLCQNNPTLTASITGGIAPFSYQWLFNGNPVGTDSPMLVATTPGDYSVTVTDANGCSNTDSLNITVDTIAVTISVDDLCQTNPTLTANVTGGIAPFSYQWLFNGNPVGTDLPILVATTSGDYSIIVTDANSCITSSSIVINADNITATISSINLNLCTALLTANVTGGIAPFSYQWFFNGAPIAGESLETLTATDSGDYSVIVTDTNGCIASDTFNIILGDCCIKPEANTLSRAICQKYRNSILS